MTQLEAIKHHLKFYGEINPLMALERYGCMRLAARIADLRYTGMKIHTEIHRAGDKHFANYRIEHEKL